MNIKRILILVFFSYITLFVNAQTGLNFQGVARSSNNNILASQPISLRLSILQGSANGIVEYVEVRKVNTNAQGLFSVVIGDEEATNTIGSISNVNWKNTPKFLKIEMDASAGNNFTIVGTTQFQYVAYAQFAKSVDAENIAGIIPVEKGGTGVASITALKTSLDLGSKANLIDLKSGLDNKVDKVAGKTLSTNDFTTVEKNKLASITGTNTGDQDLSSYATISSLGLKANVSDVNAILALKENLNNKSSATDLGGSTPSDILYPTQKAVKAYITANNTSGGVADGGITTNKLADAAVSFQKFQSIPSNTILGNTSSSTSSIQAINTTGVDNVVLSSNPIIQSPTLITPTIGDAIATSINNVTINALNGNASLTVRGNVTLRGMNNGDDAPNLRYENILTDIVSLTANQPIDGQKTFQNNIVMGNIGGISNTSSPTTIQFRNGSQVGDVQNINEGNPDLGGSLDLYAPDGAKWVQLNYANRNYISLGTNFIGLLVNNNEWDFDENGFTVLPGELFTHGSIYFSDNGITNLPNASIESKGPLLDLKARMYTQEEWDNEDDYGIELNYADKTKLKLDDFGIKIHTSNSFLNSSSYFETGPEYLYFTVRKDPNINLFWKLEGSTGKTILPGKLEVEGDLKLGDVLYSNEGGTSGDVLTYDGNGHAVWQAPITTNGFATGTDGNDFNISSASGIHTFNLPDASTLNRGLLKSDDFTRFNNKQDALINPITGTGSNGQLSFFNSNNSISSSSNLFWDKYNFFLGIGTNTPESQLHIKQGTYNEFGLLLTSPELPPSNIDPNPPKFGSSIGFVSNVGSGTNSKSGSFQLDADGNMVFRTKQSGMYFDNFDKNGNGFISFRVGPEGGPYYGMNLDKDGNLNVDGNVSSAGTRLTSDIRLKKNILPLNNALNILKQLNPVAYQKKLSLESNDYSINENGFIAQELDKVLPNLVHASEDKDHLLSVNYTAIIPILTKGIQEQQVEIENLRKELQELKKLLQTKHKLK